MKMERNGCFVRGTEEETDFFCEKSLLWQRHLAGWTTDSLTPRRRFRKSMFQESSTMLQVFSGEPQPLASQGREHQIELGVRYQGRFREYLLGNAEFPSNAALVVQVSNSHTPLQVFSFPYSKGTLTGNHQHSFFAQGILFWLFVGDGCSPNQPTLHR